MGVPRGDVPIPAAVQTGMANPILDQFVRRATGPEHGNAAMPKCVQARWRQIQLAQNLIQLASHIALTEWCPGKSRQNGHRKLPHVEIQ
jgi:hypothetical protein